MLVEGAVAGGDGVEVNNVTIGMRKFEVLRVTTSSRSREVFQALFLDDGYE